MDKRSTTGFGQRMKRLRRDAGLSQQEVAGKIGIARATYASLEVNRRDPDLGELRSLAKFYEMPLANLITPVENTYGMVHEPTPEYTPSQESKSEPGYVYRPDKLRATLLYVLAKVGAKPNVGESTLHNLLYFIDCGYQESFGRSITGLTFVHGPHGPKPTRSFLDLVRQMEANGELEIIATRYFNNTQKKYLPTKKADLRCLDARELESINETLTRLGDKTATELVELSDKEKNQSEN